MQLIREDRRSKMLKKFIVIVIFLSAAGVAAQTGEVVWNFAIDSIGKAGWTESF